MFITWKQKENKNRLMIYNEYNYNTSRRQNHTVLQQTLSYCHYFKKVIWKLIISYLGTFHIFFVKNGWFYCVLQKRNSCNHVYLLYMLFNSTQLGTTDLFFGWIFFCILENSACETRHLVTDLHYKPFW